jgi:hypothetical protein
VGQPGPRFREPGPHRVASSFFAVLFTSTFGVAGAAAEPTVTIMPAEPSVVPRAPARSSLPYVGDLDGAYVWLGINGAATHDDEWDSVFGVQTSVFRVRERSWLALLGGGIAGSRVATEGWRVSLDALAGTRIASRATVGIGIGPVVDLHDQRHARVGATATVWAFVGVTPYVRAGVLEDGSTYVDVGMQIGLPVFRF